MARAFLSKVTSRSKDSAQQWQPPEELAPVALPGQDKLSGGQGPPGPAHIPVLSDVGPRPSGPQRGH